MGVLENSTEKSIVKNDSVYNYRLKTFQSSLNLLTHVLIGIVVGGCLVFAFRAGLPLRTTPIHIVLCVIGYQLLMAEAILSLSPHNTWTAHLRLVDKKRAHWVMIVVGSGMAIAGSLIKSIDKSVNFTTLHGQFGLVALIFSSLSMINGLAALYAYEFRKVIPAKVSKLAHICCGIIAFGAANIALCYGFEKHSFTDFFNPSTGYALMVCTGVLTFSIFVSPFLTFVTKIRS